MTSDTWRLLRLRLRNHLPLMVGMAVVSTLVAAGCWKLEALWLPHLERTLYDSALTQFTRDGSKSGEIVVVAIDQTSLDGVRNNPTYARNFGNYPWTRSLWARVVEELAHQGARAVLFDMVMDERYTDASADLAFAEVLRNTGMPFYLGMSTHPSGAALPKVEPVHIPLTPAAPRPPAKPAAPADEQAEFEELEEPAQEAVDPEQAARVLSVPVRSEGHALPLLESEPTPGERVRNYVVPPVPALLAEVGGFGLVEVEADPDGSMRRTRFAYTDGANAYLTLPVALAADMGSSMGARSSMVSSALPP
jgi:adenylate cyclase